MNGHDKFLAVLDKLCPMYAILEPSGHISRCGPTLQKLRPDTPLSGRRFLEVFELDRPRQVTTVDALRKHAGVKLHLKFRDEPQTGLKGVLSPLGDSGISVVNLSFGISILDAVREYNLTSADFAPTDLTIEMLYLIEAKSAAMEASRKLNTRLQGAKIAAEEQAFTDTLTGLKNRRALDHILARKRDDGMPYAVMQVDLDFFKQVNDTLGHAAGDHVLQQAARILVEETRDADTVARAGGDEFVLVLDGATSEEQLGRIAQRIINRLEVPIPFEGKPCEISASIGIARSSALSGSDAPDPLVAADTALYASKRGGRAQYSLYATAS